MTGIPPPQPLPPGLSAGDLVGAVRSSGYPLQVLGRGVLHGLFFESCAATVQIMTDPTRLEERSISPTPGIDLAPLADPTGGPMLVP